MRRRRKKHKFSTLIVLFVISLFCFSIGYSLLQEKLSIQGKGSIVVDTTDDFTYTVTENGWDNNGQYSKQYQFTIQNVKDVSYVGWYATATVNENDSISGCWNTNCVIENGVLKLTNVSYNGNVAPNGTVEFGLIINHINKDSNLSDIKFYGITSENSGDQSGEGDKEEDKEEDTEENLDESIEITYTLGDAWQDSGIYHQMITFNITNNRETAITSWQMDLDRKKYNLRNVYNANYIEKETLLRFSNVSYNGTIYPGNTVSFQIELTGSEKDFNLSIVNITGSV